MRKLKGVLTTGDFVLIGILCFSTLLSFFIFRLLPQRGQFVSIVVDGRLAYRFNLSEEKEINVQGKLGKTCVKLVKGCVWISETPCPQKICMKMGKISRSGEMIVCVPNRILVKIEGEKKQILDGITM